MRRKSERNKAKGSPEKKVEKPTRKSTRRRGKRSPTVSPEREVLEQQAESTQVEENNEKDGIITVRCQNKEQGKIADIIEDRVSSTERVVKSESPEEEDDIGESVWKVARADASPGEIQKLTLCRQRNTSETSSDASGSRRKANKWQESGEGVAGEVDSADETLVSSKRTPSGTEQPDDPSSSYPCQDSNEEVSDSKEILPETTSANLSDDKPNIDQQGDTNEASCSIQNIDSESSKPNNTTDPTSNSNGDYAATSEEITSIIIKEEPIVEPSTTEEKPIKVEETKKEEIAPKEIKREDSSDDNENEEAEPKIQKITKISQSESSSESQDEARTKSSPTTVRTTSRSARRKPRDKYRDSSNSESQDSEDEASIESKIDKSVIQKNQSDVEASQEEKEPSGSPDHNANTVLDDAGIDTETCESTREKPDTSIKKLEPIVSSIQSTNNKPAKVSLKRSFASRIAEKSESKLDNPEGSNNAESINQNQESYSNGNEEQKCIPRKRRWGITSLSTDTAPSFSISTDSLKELVPGAKPLPINEVRLSKDDDEEKETHNDIEKWHSINSSTGETVNKDENTQKNGTAKKGDGKTDNHLGTRRKISIVKDTPHLKSPSPPASTPTNILLIKNLVRPFTLNQIKELLTRTGTIVENGFWMDRIKSKCFVEYTNEDQAFETRQALHGISWPVSNPKRLLVEYATKEDMEMARELSKDQPILRKTEPLVSTDIWQHDWGRDEKTNVAKVTVVREWDLGKEENQQHVKEKEREKKEDKKRRLRSRSPAMEAHLPAPARKFKKKEDDPPPAKLLDDLFRKTKATPCIYWLPLTNEQIVVKEEMRRQHMAEHARRLEEMRRAERNRDGRRRRSPRK